MGHDKAADLLERTLQEEEDTDADLQKLQKHPSILMQNRKTKH
jgi:ferritin-like metal-binding protein YciE